MTEVAAGAAQAPGVGGRRIALVANTDWFLFNFRLSLARALRQAGWEPLLVSPPGPYTARLEAEGFRWAPVRISRRGVFPPGELATVFSLLGTYRRFRPDLVHHHTLKVVLYGTLAARAAGVPGIVDSVTGLGFVFLSRRIDARLLRPFVARGLRLALSLPGVHVVFENPGDRDYLLSRRLAPADRNSLIEGVGVDLGRFAPTREPGGEPVVVMASRMLWDKGVGDFVEAARRLRREGRAARFVLVGAPDPGNPSSIPAGRIRHWTQEGVVEWWGHVDDMPGVLARSHIVVLPSYGEGVPTVLQEAAACGRPVVASDIPGCRAVVRDGETGLLSPPGDPAALSRAIARLLEDPEARRRMGQQARREAEANFSQDAINQRTMLVYRNLLRSVDQA